MAVWESRRAVQVLPSGCIIWTGTVDAKGYSRIASGGTVMRGHRLAYEQAFGPIPEGMHICHKCDVRSCINPDHLFCGTHADNMADKARKGRVVPMIGERNGNAKVTATDVAVIRKMHAAGASMIQIGKVYDISDATAYSICHGRTWKHLGVSA